MHITGWEVGKFKYVSEDDGKKRTVNTRAKRVTNSSSRRHLGLAEVVRRNVFEYSNVLWSSGFWCRESGEWS